MSTLNTLLALSKDNSSSKNEKVLYLETMISKIKITNNTKFEKKKMKSK